MARELASLEREAINRRNAGEIERAAELFAQIIERRPDFEHGLTLHDLAGCYEDLGRYEEARRCYLRALEYGPDNETIQGGYASFLYLHGDPGEALEAHTKLWELERSRGNLSGSADTMTAIRELAKRLGLSLEEVESRFKPE